VKGSAGTKKGKEASVIKVIQEMLRAGESEEAIIKTLLEMGINENQAKRLLAVSQADTLALLQAEIGKIVREQLENELPALQTYIDKSLIQIRADLEGKLKGDVKAAIAEAREDLKRDVKLLHDVTDSTGEKIKSIEEKLADLRLEVKEMRMRRLGTKNEWVALMLVLGGIAFYITALYLLLVQFQNITMDLLILIITIAITGTTMFFGSSII
jgi:thiamine pyrophosphate-dependent acetolactate synthase large subunit-like protein